MYLRYAFLVGLAVLCAACSTSTGPETDSEFREVKHFSRGQTIVVPAPLGTSDSILGMAYDANLNDKDSAGVRHRMYPHVVTYSTEKFYRSSVTILESKTEIDASANVLFVAGGITRKHDMRYAVYKVESISRIASLQPEGSPLYAGQLYASKIYYGWTLYYVFEGDATQINEHVAATLTKIIDAGGSLTNEVNRLQIRKYLVARGLTPKNPNSVPIAHDPADIDRYFTISGSDKQPIGIEYECATSFTVPAYNIDAPKYTPGNFVLDSLQFSIAETDADGSSWDGDGSAPDPIIQIYRNGTVVYTTQIDDQFEGIIGINRRIAVGTNDRINVVLWDKDELLGGNDDFVGDFGLNGSKIFNGYYLYDPVPMDPTSSGGQIKNVTLYIYPVR